MNDLRQLKKSAKVALGAMLVLLMGALLFYKERVLFIDDAHICFRIINLKRLVIEEHRYGSFITQVVPYIGMRLHMSIKLIMIAYSLSFNLFYLAVILLLIYRFKEYGMAILLAFYYTLFISDGYFWTNNEVHQATAWLFLSFGVVFTLARSKKPLTIQVAAFIPLFLLSVFTHPLAMISVIFLWIFFMLDREHWPFDTKRSVLFTSLLILVILIKYYISSHHGYDSNKIENATKISASTILHTFSNGTVRTFLYDCVNNYWWIFPIILGGFWKLIKEKRYWSLIWVVICTVTFFVLMGTTYGNVTYGRGVLFYMESEWATLSIILAAPFVYYFLPKIRSRWAILILAAIFITRFIYIGNALPLFHQRIVFMKKGLQNMRKTGLKKVVVLKDPRMQEHLVMDWGLPVETILLSKLQGDNPQLTIVEIKKENILNRLPDTDVNSKMIYCFDLLKYRLNHQYFSIDTTGPYVIKDYHDVFGN